MSYIPKRIFKKLGDDEDFNQWRAKKIISTYNEHSKYYQIKKAALNSKLNTQNLRNSHNKFNVSLKNDYSKETIVKITSNSKNFQQLSGHIKYISRDGELEIIDSNMNVFKGKEENEFCLDSFQNYGRPIPNKYEVLKEKRETYNIVLSMKDYKDCPIEKLKSATYKTIKELYPNNYFVMALHIDTDNPHCHICLKVSDNYYKRTNIQKSDLFRMREQFAKNLNDLGVEAQATKRNNRSITTSVNLNDLSSNKGEIIKPHYYKVIDYGRAPYQNNENNKESFFVQYITPRGVSTIWANDLERIIKESHLQKGEYAKFSKIGHRTQPLNFNRKISGKDYEIVTAKKVAIWDISILHRAEKQFTKLPPVKISHIMRPVPSYNKGVKDEPRIQHRRIYTKEEWAKFYAQKRARSKSWQRANQYEYNAANIGIYKSNYNELRYKIESINDLPKLPKISVVSEQQESKMLLSSNAHNKLSER